MNEHQKIIIKSKRLLQDIFATRYYQYLKRNYVPKVFKPNIDEEGQLIEENGYYTGTAVLVQTNIPDKEEMAYALALLRQFILKKDTTSIFKIGEHIMAIGTKEDYQNYNEGIQKFDRYINGLSGVTLRKVDESEDLIKEKQLTRMDLIKTVLYGDMVHRDDKKVPHTDIFSMNKIAEYFLGMLVYVCQIVNIIKTPSFNIRMDCKENCPENILLGRDRSAKPKTVLDR